MLNRLSLEKKFIIVVISCVIGAIAVLSGLIIRRESMLIREDHRKNAEIVMTAISKALEDNMLAGRPEETKRLIGELSGLEGVTGVTVMKPDGKGAFGLGSPELPMRGKVMERIGTGEEIDLAVGDTRYFLRPLMNTRTCRSCHPGSDKIRGIVVAAMSETDIDRNIMFLVGRMALFGAVTAFMLAAVLVLLSRRMLLSPIKGLTIAARSIMNGDFGLFKPRGTACFEVMGCRNDGCPAFGDEHVPCWMQAETLCNSDAGAPETSRNCSVCRVYRELKGDEMVQLQDNFNMMSRILKSNEENTSGHIAAIEGLNRELSLTNKKLSTLLEASQLSSSSLDLDQTLSACLRFILSVTNLDAGIVFLLDRDRNKTCHEFFGCTSYHCSGFRPGMSCWLAGGTVCADRGSLVFSCQERLRSSGKIPEHASPFQDTLSAPQGDRKLSSCGQCDFFRSLDPRPSADFGFAEGLRREILEEASRFIRRSLLTGKVRLEYAEDAASGGTRVALPLRSNGQILGLLYLVSGEKQPYGEEELDFFRVLSGVLSTGIFNSGVYEDIEVSYFQTVMSLSNAIEAKDPYTRGHSERVAELSLKAADAFNLTTKQKEYLRFAAILHDVGKIGVSRELLRKRRGLDSREEEEIRSHPERGVQILEPVHFLKPVLPVIRHHHERYDGQGYPLGLKGKEIPFKARILAVADAWDAMLSDRPYRRALSVEAATDELKRNSGTQFDPEVVVFFVNSLQL